LRRERIGAVRAVVQRVSRASVEVEGRPPAEIGKGVLVLLGVGRGDTEEDAALLARKIPRMRIFPDDDGRMNLSLLDVGGSVLVVSQFTLFGTWRRGNRPGFTAAASPAEGKALYDVFVEKVRGEGVRVETGVFGAMMRVSLVNEGPVTLLLDTRAPE